MQCSRKNRHSIEMRVSLARCKNLIQFRVEFFVIFTQRWYFFPSPHNFDVYWILSRQYRFNGSAEMWNDSKRQNSDKIPWIICFVCWAMAVFEMRSAKSSAIDENAFDVPFWFAMKSINFKCLTTAISVDWWNECRVRRKKGANALCWKPKQPNHRSKNHVWSMKTAHQPRWRIMPQHNNNKNTSRVDDNDASIPICNSRHEWNKNSGRYSFIHVHFWR